MPTISTGLVSEYPGVDQEIPRTDLHGRDHHHRAGQVVLPAVVAVAERNHTCVLLLLLLLCVTLLSSLVKVKVPCVCNETCV